MAEKVLIMGESGTGKSTSLRNLDPNKVAIINPVGKPLPFRGGKRFDTLNGETDADKICEYMKNQARAGKKIIVVDDFQYILAVPFMDRIKETGWDKFNDFGSNYFNIIDVCKELPEDVIVYYLTHCETLENGITTVKLIGKLLREKITIEGLFTIVLRTGVSEGKYYFYTQNSGKDTVKSPMGMFDTFSIENDLNYVDAKIRNYYEFDNAVSDDEIKKLDTEKAGEVEAPVKVGRRTRIVNAEKVSREEKKEAEIDKARAEYIKDGFKKLDADGREEIPFKEATEMIEESLKEAYVNIPDQLEELNESSDKQSEESAESTEAPTEVFEKPQRRTRKVR